MTKDASLEVNSKIVELDATFKTTQQRACIGLIFVAALLIKVPLANAQQQSFVFPQVADGVFDGGYYKTTFMIQPAHESSTLVVTCGYVLHGLGVDLDGKGLVTEWTAAISPGSYYVASTSADQQLRTGYATLSCTDSVYAQVLYSAYAKDGTNIAQATVPGSNDSACSALNSAQMTADQQSGSQLGIAIANNTTQTQSYRVIFSSPNGVTPPFSLQATVTVPAQTSVAKFLTEILPASSNTVGWVEIAPADQFLLGTGFSAIALRYTGATFTTIPVSCYLC
jgi:hypothetical protein